MKALIFAAGVGSRLKPWTNNHPKALVDVAGKPMLQRVIENIISAGIDDIIINVHHFGEQIIEFIANNHFEADIRISDERKQLLDTGGGLRKVIPWLNDESVLIHNADILTDYNLKNLVKSHISSSNDATLLVAPRQSSRRLVFSKNMLMKGWTNLDTGEVKPAGLKSSSDDRLLSFNGIHIFSSSLYKQLLDYQPAETPFSIIDFYVSKASLELIGGELLPEGCRWFDVGKPKTLEEARKAFSVV